MTSADILWTYATRSFSLRGPSPLPQSSSTRPAAAAPSCTPIGLYTCPLCQLPPPPSPHSQDRTLLLSEDPRAPVGPSHTWGRSRLCVALTRVSLPSPWLGALPQSFLVADFRRRGVDVSQVAWQSQGDTPCSCCIVNNSNGSRTIILYDT